MSFLSFRDVTYRRGDLTVLNGVSFDLEPGETIVLLGRSGSGKTTALRLINRLLDGYTGNILFDGKDVSRFTDSAPPPYWLCDSGKLDSFRIGLWRRMWRLFQRLKAGQASSGKRVCVSCGPSWPRAR